MHCNFFQSLRPISFCNALSILKRNTNASLGQPTVTASNAHIIAAGRAVGLASWVIIVF